jgi:hypothetical protein
MKRLILVFTIVVLCLSLSACSNPKRDIGTSEIFTTKEIGKAMDTVEKDFRSDYKDCELTDLWYDEESAIQYTEGDYTSGTTIIIYSNFTVGDNGPAELNPNFKYKSYSWTLVRDDSHSSWKVKDRGYC